MLRMTVSRGTAIAMVAGTALFALAGGANAAYPERPIRFIVPFPPSGANDIVARIMAQKFSESLGVQMVVDNRAGGGQVIGTELAAKAVPNGYTVFLASVTHSINPALHARLPYDSYNDFSKISLIADSPLLFVANMSAGFATIRDMIALAKAKPGSINYASSGIGSGGHLAVEMLKFMTGIEMLHVPYKGAGPALADLLGGQVQVWCTSPLSVIPQIKAGRLRALAITSRTRSQAAPELPTLAESGVPGYEVTLWYALLGPAGIPAAVVRRLNAETIKAVRSPDVIEKLSVQGVYPIGSSDSELASFLKSETAKWEKVIRAAKIRPD